MNNIRSLHRKKIFMTAAVLSVLVVVTTVASAVFVAMETEHDCEGEECHVCECIEICEAILQQAGTALPIVTASLVFFAVPVFINLPDVCVFCLRTPVSRKVRLNN
jgi:hypothetical protein